MAVLSYSSLCWGGCPAARVSILPQSAGAGEKLPSLDVALAYAETCGGDRQVWKECWQAVATQLTQPPEEIPDTETQVGEMAVAPDLDLANFLPEDVDPFPGREQLGAD